MRANFVGVMFSISVYGISGVQVENFSLIL